jgi:phage I-like protein
MGWIRDLRVVAGAIHGRIEWTVRGAAAFKTKEYRFVSPVFSFDPPAGSDDGAQTGRVVQIMRGALTNNPALSDLPAIAASRIELSAMEKKICSDMGTSEADYAAAKARRLSVAPRESMTLAQRIEQIEKKTAEERRLRGTYLVALSADEKKICAAFGTSEADYAAAKARRQRGGQRIFAGVALTDDQLAICRSFGTDPAAFAARLKDRQAGKPLVLSGPGKWR